MKISIKNIDKSLYTAEIPDPDILIKQEIPEGLVILCSGNWHIQKFILRKNYGQILMKRTF